MKVTVKSFGELGENLIIIENKQGTILELSNFGARIVRWLVKDKKGDLTNIVLGFESGQQFVTDGPYFGATIGRVAGRLTKGSYDDGERVQLTPNEGENTLHGGPNSFETKIWQTEIKENQHEIQVVFTYESPAGENGFPGNLQAVVSHTFNEENEWRLDYSATTDERTLYNPTNHVYFNLAKSKQTSIGSHRLYLASTEFIVLDPESLPTGEIRSVKGTSFDFSQSGGRVIQPSLMSNEEQIKLVGGIDHPFILNHVTEYQAILAEETTGITLGMTTTAPAVVVYTTNIGEEKLAMFGEVVSNHGGITLETQILPDAINQQDFGSIVLEKDQVFHSQTSYFIL